MDTERERIPEAIEKEMKAWRRGFCSLPQSYIAWHRDKAAAATELLKVEGHQLLADLMVDDVWGDEMRFLAVICLDPWGMPVYLKWSDSQAWYEKSRSGGWVLYSLNFKRRATERERKRPA